MKELYDSWPERGGIVGSTVTVVRVGVWLWRRKSGQPTTAPFFGWIARRIVVESALIVKDINLRTEKAKNKRLLQIIKEAGIPLDSELSSERSCAWPGSTLVKSRPPTSKPSASTSGKPESDPT